MFRINSAFVKRMMKWVAALGVLGATCYPVILFPMMNPTPYKELQKVVRKDIDREKIQPGNMKIWTDPFGRK